MSIVLFFILYFLYDFRVEVVVSDVAGHYFPLLNYFLHHNEVSCRLFVSLVLG